MGFQDAGGFYSPAFFLLVMKALYSAKNSPAAIPLILRELQGSCETDQRRQRTGIRLARLRAPPYGVTWLLQTF